MESVLHCPFIHQGVSPCMGSLRGLQQPSHLNRIPADFHSHMLWRLTLALVVQAGEPGVRIWSLNTVGTLQLRYPSYSQPPHIGGNQSVFLSTPLTSLSVSSSSLPSGRWFSKMVVLSSSGNYGMVVGEASTTLTCSAIFILYTLLPEHFPLLKTFDFNFRLNPNFLAWHINLLLSGSPFYSTFNIYHSLAHQFYSWVSTKLPSHGQSPFIWNAYLIFWRVSILWNSGLYHCCWKALFDISRFPWLDSVSSFFILLKSLHSYIATNHPFAC